jgi:hypothetical protein
MLFINTNDTVRFIEYLRANGVADPKWIGNKAMGSKHDPNAEYRYAKVDISSLDLTALKLMFDIRRSLF